MTAMKALLLAGGQSSRMGSRKELLCLPDGTPLFIHMITLLHQALPESEHIYLSLRDRSKLKDLVIPGKVSQKSDEHIVVHSEGGPVSVQVLFDNDLVQGDYGEIGPAKGLLRAHEISPSCPWLVVACDYPFLCAGALDQLLQEYSGSVTVFCNIDGYSEPLVGIWRPEALDALRRAVENGITGPSFVVRQLGGYLIRPECNKWLTNVNTPEEWEEVIKES